MFSIAYGALSAVNCQKPEYPVSVGAVSIVVLLVRLFDYTLYIARRDADVEIEIT